MARLRDAGRFTALRARQAGRLVRDVLTRNRPADIAAYRGYGSSSRAYLHGRALAKPRYTTGREDDSPWRNLLNTYRRARSNPIASAEVRVEFGGVSRTLTADDEGFFSGWLDLAEGQPPAHGWHASPVELVSPVVASDSVSATGQVLIPHPRAAFGVISDLDDTVIQSRVTNFLQAARTVMFGNALTRLPFEGVAEFYHALNRGRDSGPENPLFYVSSSPWNLYDVIEDFLAVQGIPHGPLLLRNWDFSPRGLGAHQHHAHKGDAIREIMDTYPSLPFILIGDSGQRDPEIYHEIVHDYLERIIAVYIRDVVRTPEREQAIAALAHEVEIAGSSLLLVHDTRAAAAHAAERRWIADDEVEAVAREAAADSGDAPGKKPVPL
ncbi:MAG TPA: phosphatase domain-containing protein [Gemmatimonadaceae bacterium]|nr:phosphatase domain-containing protein [Gemmatimonadaceae bacterium]